MTTSRGTSLSSAPDRPAARRRWALAADPGLSVVLLDRAGFPRDKACGDGIAPHVLDVLADVGVTGLLDDRTPVQRLSLSRAGATVSRSMRRPAWVVPRKVFDARLVERAVDAGASLVRRHVREAAVTAEGLVLDGAIRARVVVAADGAHSALRAGTGARSTGRTAFALRGYAPTAPGRRGQQVLVFGGRRQPSYAWAFDRGDGLANVGYGELLGPGRAPMSRTVLLDQLEELIPGSVVDGEDWRGHHLPLSGWSWSQPDGRVLLAGDAASLVNPMTGEGIYYAVATGVLAGRSAVTALRADGGAGAGARHRHAVRGLLAGHLRHTAGTAALVRHPAFVEAGLRAVARDQRTFDDLVEIGLGRGRLTPGLLRAVAGALPRAVTHARADAG